MDPESVIQSSIIKDNQFSHFNIDHTPDENKKYLIEAEKFAKNHSCQWKSFIDSVMTSNPFDLDRAFVGFRIFNCKYFNNLESEIHSSVQEHNSFRYLNKNDSQNESDRDFEATKKYAKVNFYKNDSPFNKNDSPNENDQYFKVAKKYAKENQCQLKSFYDTFYTLRGFNLTKDVKTGFEIFGCQNKK